MVAPRAENGMVVLNLALLDAIVPAEANQPRA
jgi:hypothetical protein